MCKILLNGDVAFNRYGILKSTLKYHYVKFESVANLLGIPFGDVTREQYFGTISKRPLPLLSMYDVTFLSKTIISRGKNNNEMGRDDVVNLVMELFQNTNRHNFEYHYDYLVRRKKIDGVNRDGRVMAAQPKKNNRSAITVLQKCGWYSTLEDSWDK